jgi:hydrogenase expression/formation protein HypC
MCLAVPGKILSIVDEDPLTRTGKVSFGGIAKDINLAYVPEADVGDYVIVHVGFALSVVNEEEAQETFKYIQEIDAIHQKEEALLNQAKDG